MQSKAALFLAVLALGFALGWFLRPTPDAGVVVHEHTTITRDTVTREIIRQPVYVTNLVPYERPQDSGDVATFGPAVVPDSMPDPFVDSVRQVFDKDTVDALYAWPQRRFTLALRAGPDLETTIRTDSTTVRTVEKPVRQPFGLGFFAGYGFSLDGQTSGWTVGVGVSVNLFSIGL